MKYELLLISILTILLLSTFLAAADPIQNTFGATITIGSNSTTTTSSQSVTINNPASINFQIMARDSSAISQQLNVSLYDHVNHHFLNNSNFVGLGNIFSPTSLSDLELDYDNQNLGVFVYGLNMTNISTSMSQVIFENTNPQISHFTPYRGYHVELPWNSSTYNSITLAISLAGINNVNYTSIVVYRCGNYNPITNVCSDSGGWVPQTISVDPVNKIVTLTINHFSVYAVGSGNGLQSYTTSSTTTSSSSTSTSTYTTTSSYTPPVNNPAPVSSGGGGGGAAYIPPVTTTTTSASTTTTTVLIVKRNDTSSTSTSEATSFPISGLLGLTNQFSPVLIVAVIIVASVAAIPLIKNRNSFSGLNPFRKSYQTFPTRKIKKGKKNTELKLSL